MADQVYKAHQVTAEYPDADFADFQDMAENMAEDFFHPFSIENVTVEIEAHQGGMINNVRQAPWANVTLTYHKDKDDQDAKKEPELTGGRSVFGAYDGPPPF